MHELRLLEGELLLRSGVVYVVKGYQHPDDVVIAYPRYNLLEKRKLGKHEEYIYVNNYYWDCLKSHVPVIPLRDIYPLHSVIEVNHEISVFKSTLESILERELYLTGSSILVEKPVDVDLVLYGADVDIVEKIRGLFNRGLFKRPLHVIVGEYIHRHRDRLELVEYYELKKDTILHGYFMNIHFNIKLYEYRKGYVKCTDPVLDYSSYSGIIKVLEPVNPRILPARYLALIKGRDIVIVLETHRELYAELKPGLYLVEKGRLENRSSGIYLLPDHGVLRPVITSRDFT